MHTGRILEFRKPESARVRSPKIPVWDVDATVMLTVDLPGVPQTVEVRWRFLVNPDNSLTIKLQREGDTYSHIFLGSSETRAVTMLRELLAASFGVPA